MFQNVQTRSIDLRACQISEPYMLTLEMVKQAELEPGTDVQVVSKVPIFILLVQFFSPVLLDFYKFKC